MAVSNVISTSEDHFIIRLIEAVQKHPCLYNPNDENYGNRHTSAQHRTRVWQKLCRHLNFDGDPHCLQSQWKRIRDRYVREKRKRRNLTNDMENTNGQQSMKIDGDSERSLSEIASNSTTTLVLNRLFELMRWIDPYLIDSQSNNSGVVGGAHAVESSSTGSSPIQKVQISQTGNISQGQAGVMTVVVTTSSGMEAAPYYENLQQAEQNQAAQSLMAAKADLLTSNYETHESGQQMQTTSAHTQNDYSNKQRRNNLPNGASGVTSIVGVQSSTNPSPSSSTTGSEIDVGSVSNIAGQSQVSQAPQANIVMLTSASPQTRQPTRILYSKPDAHPRSVQTSDGSVYTLMAQGVAPIKKEAARTSESNAVAMVIDTTSYYQHGNQKMYRLVNVSEVNPDLGQISTGNVGPSTSEIKIIAFPRVQTSNDNVQRRKRLAPGSMPSLVNGRGQLGEDLILEDSGTVAEKTVSIDQCTSSASSLNSDRILIDHSSVNVAGTSNMLIGGHNVQQIHIQHAGQSQQHATISGGAHQITHHVSHPSSLSMNVVGMRPQPQSVQPRFIPQPMTIQPQPPQYTVLTNRQITSHHDDDLEFANSIATHLARLNDDEKAVAKMNIQRILMDARFGIGACARMIHDEDLNEGNNSNSHDMVNSSQQLVDPSSRR